MFETLLQLTLKLELIVRRSLCEQLLGFIIYFDERETDVFHVIPIIA